MTWKRDLTKKDTQNSVKPAVENLLGHFQVKLSFKCSHPSLKSKILREKSHVQVLTTEVTTATGCPTLSLCPTA